MPKTCSDSARTQVLGTRTRTLATRLHTQVYPSPIHIHNHLHATVCSGSLKISYTRRSRVPIAWLASDEVGRLHDIDVSRPQQLLLLLLQSTGTIEIGPLKMRVSRFALIGSGLAGAYAQVSEEASVGRMVHVIEKLAQLRSMRSCG
jgi:hypothetical protein